MLSYEEFKKVLTETFMDHMPEKFRGYVQNCNK